MKKLTFFFLVFLPFFGISQQITGTVYSKADQEVLIGAAIYNVSKHVGAISDLDGLFAIEAEQGDTLQISYIGLNTQEIIVDSNTIDIYLEEGGPLFCGPLNIMAERYLNPHSFKLIERIDLPVNQIQGVQDMYNKVPGLFMHSGALNTNRLTIRGIGSRSAFATTKIRAYVNDIPITTGIGESNLEDINFAFIDNIRIYKGPTRPAFGSGLGGAIHYVTKKSEGNSIAFSNRLTLGSFNSVKNNTQAIMKHKKFSVAMNYDVMKSNGYRENNQYSRTIFSALAVRYFRKGELSLFVNTTDLSAEIPSALNQTDFDNNPTMAATNWNNVNGNEQNARTFGGLSYKHVFRNDIVSTNTIFAGKYINDERRPFNVLAQNSGNIGFRSNTELRYKNRQGAFHFGTEIFRETEHWTTAETADVGRGDFLSDNVEKRSYLNVFVENKYKWNYLGLRAGLNVNFTQYHLTDQFMSNGDQSGAYNYNPIVSPFLSLDYGSMHQIYYFTISHGYSIPTLEETLTPEDLINEAIEPETGFNFEIGIRDKIGNWNIDASLYYMYVFNLLVPERVTEDQYIAINAGRTGHPGLEISINRPHRFNDEIWIKPSLNYQFGPHKFIEFNNQDQDFSGSFLPGNPNHKMNFSLLFHSKKWVLDWTNMYVSGMFADDANTIDVPGYFLSNVYANYRIIKKGNWILGINGTVNNITNTKYASMLAVNPRSFGGNAPRFLYPGLSRNYYVGFEVEYKLDGAFKS